MKSKIVNVLTIHSKGTDPFKTLAWWNISKIKIKDIDYILIHQGKGNVSQAFKLDRTKDGLYKMVDDYDGQKAKNPYVEVVFPDGSKRVSFLDFSDWTDLDYTAIELPKTKQGQAQPLQILQLDLSTMKIVEAQKKEKKSPKKKKNAEMPELAA